MKKILLSFALFISSTLLFSQTKFGIKAGINFANQEFSTEGISASFDALPSFHLIGLIDYSISKSISIQPGIGISGKGFKVKEDGMELKANLLYLDIPVNIVAKFPIAGFGKFCIGGGPYASYGISGKASGDGVESSDNNLFTEDGYKRGDFGLNILGGLELSKGLTLNANYGLGLSNIAQQSDEGLKITNKVFSLSIGFIF